MKNRIDIKQEIIKNFESAIKAKEQITMLFSDEAGMINPTVDQINYFKKKGFTIEIDNYPEKVVYTISYKGISFELEQFL